MNSILNDLTYCDGRFEKDVKATFSDSPSRLKLRSNTFQGIQTSLEKRRTPAKTNDFFIPSAALPQMNVVEDGGQGGASIETATVGINYRNPEELATQVGYGASKKLKVGSKQFEGLNISRAKNMPEMAPVAEAKENTVEEAKEVAMPAPISGDIQPELPKVELPKVEPVREEVKKEEPVVAPIPVQPVANEMPSPVTPIEEKPVITADTKEVNNSVEEKVDEFANLQNVTERYQQAASEYNTAKQELDSAEKELSTSKKQLETTEREISEKEEEITSQRNVIDTARKDIASLQEEVEKVREEVKKKIIAIDKAREKKARETKEVATKTKQTKEANEQYQQGIEANNKTLENMKKESQALTDEENQVLNEKARVRSELERVEEILKAITLPEGAEEFINEVAETPSMEQENRDNIITFPNHASDIVNEDVAQKSIGAYKAA